MLLPLALSQGWSVTRFAREAQMGNGDACALLRRASEEAGRQLANLESVDALALSVEIEGKPITLGEIQGRKVKGAVKSLGRLPDAPEDWTDSHAQTYRRSMQLLKDAKALGLISFGDQAQGTPGEHAANPLGGSFQQYLSQQKEAEKPKRERKSPAAATNINDDA